jgi:hypothetical protein
MRPKEINERIVKSNTEQKLNLRDRKFIIISLIKLNKIILSRKG